MQGFNMGRYVPPELEGTTSFNVASGKGHALGARARKLKSEGILIVRFECPFAIWCTNCNPEQIIGQGVRFNAEKKKVGNYYSSAIWSFRFKHTVCGEWIEVRTDPKNTEYVVVDGGRRRDTGEDKLLDGEIRIGLSEEDKDRLEREGGFGSLEKKVEDKKVFTSQKDRLEELLKASERDWADPYEKSRKLRAEFRVGRRKRQADEKTGEALQDKFSLGVEILGENEDDAQRAKYIDFGEHQNGTLASSTVAKPMFETPQPAKTDRAVTRSKKISAAALKKDTLQTTLQSNTRNAVDPFQHKDTAWQPRVKRKRVEADANEKATNDEQQPSKTQANASALLVGYDSDST